MNAGLLRRFKGVGDVEEVFKKGCSMLGENRLRVKLDTVDRIMIVLHGHDFIFVAACSDDQVRLFRELRDQ